MPYAKRKRLGKKPVAQYVGGFVRDESSDSFRLGRGHLIGFRLHAQKDAHIQVNGSWYGAVVTVDVDGRIYTGPIVHIEQTPMMRNSKSGWWYGYMLPESW